MRVGRHQRRWTRRANSGGRYFNRCFFSISIFLALNKLILIIILSYAFQQNLDKASPRQCRHLDFIGQFTIDIRHIAGCENVPADFLSRVEPISHHQPYDQKSLAEAQAEDQELQALLTSENRSSLQLEKVQIPETNISLYCDVSTAKPRPFYELLQGWSPPITSGRPSRRIAHFGLAPATAAKSPKPLAPPYDGPYEVLFRKPKIYKLKIKKRSTWVSIDRLKPAFTSEGPMFSQDPNLASQ
ncbi:hypothetical protein LAZ67_2003427 [Cordylochernes scorpioides]|uniref:Uncharacterized protein n=1 Tax=Cordylochernes scorpioides TaxID=51811 RepID=A0ABY6K3Z4_9ARAC|nr:hypothetical protein LAZ67_2003427 [Cordylochernes scorpioides]